MEIDYENGYIKDGEYVLYTEEEKQKRKVEKELEVLKQSLNDTDYEAIKYAEGYFTEEEYAPIKAYREELRIKIREIIDKENSNENNIESN